MKGVCLFLLFSMGNTARILGLFTYPGRNHWIVIEPLYKELVARGHQVTVYSAFPQNNPLPNYTNVDFSSTTPPLDSAFSINLIKNKIPNSWANRLFINKVTSRACQLKRESELQKLIKSENEYDVEITQLFGNDCYTYFAYKFKIPLIVYTTSKAMPWAAGKMGLPDDPAYIPNCLVDFTGPMSLFQRLYNVVFSWQAREETEEMLGEPLPPLKEVIVNTSLMLLNTHHVLAQPRPFPPNVLEIEGIHIKEEKPLPKDLQKILNSAANGGILLKFGSLIRSSSIPDSTIMMLMNALAKITQTAIFKYEENLPEAPPKVITRKWLPQRDCLANKNVIDIIAHQGMSSTIEAVYASKPLIGIPSFSSDQSVNVNSVVRRGAYIQLDIDTISEEKIGAAISDIVNNPKYSESMWQLSQQVRDRRLSALNTAVYWTEHVVRHQGTAHLRLAYVHLCLYQLMLLDALSGIVVTIAELLISVYYIIKCTITAIKTMTRKRIKKVHKTE